MDIGDKIHNRILHRDIPGKRPLLCQMRMYALIQKYGLTSSNLLPRALWVKQWLWLIKWDFVLNYVKLWYELYIMCV